ncbi:uncharacterized protein LOC144620638 [Crassostrea virginica]
MYAIGLTDVSTIGEPKQECLETTETKPTKLKYLKKKIHRAFTVISSPLWVPVVAVGSLLAAPIQAVKDSKEVADKTNSAGAGVSSFPGNTVVRAVTNPFKGIVKGGEALWED